MQRGQPVAFHGRGGVALLVLLVHALFLWLLLLEDRTTHADRRPLRRHLRAWILMPPPRAPDESQAAPPPVPYRAAPVERSPVSRSTTAITPAPVSGTPDPPTRIDWRAAAGKAVEGLVAGIDAPRTFTAPPQPVRKPCKPRDSSFQWRDNKQVLARKKQKELAEARQTAQLLKDHLPGAPPAEPVAPPPGFMAGGGSGGGFSYSSCGITLGCEKPEPYSHLFDDMLAGKVPESSVPSVEYCD